MRYTPMATGLPFNAVSREPSLADRVAQELTEAIVSGRLAPGDRLPAERDLGEQFHVSRTVIREAVRSLVARGLVKITSGRGVEIAELGAGIVADSLRLFIRGQGSFDYRKIHEVRSTIEVENAALAATRRTPEDVERLSELCDELEEHLRKEDWLSASRDDFEFHRALAVSTGNELFLIVLDSVADVLREVRDRAYPHPGVGAAGLKQHRQILRHVEAGDREAARNAMVVHLAEAERIWMAEQNARS
jgi:GntR family transcriptional repressor for pyruvate dehydrogenase complex